MTAQKNQKKVIQKSDIKFSLSVIKMTKEFALIKFAANLNIIMTSKTLSI